MKNKRYFLLGIGTGLIMAAIFMTLFGSLNILPQSGNPNPAGISDQTPYPAQTPSDQQSPDRQESGEPTQESTPGEQSFGEELGRQSEQTVEIFITAGMSANNIADLLLKENIITDKDSFMELVRQEGVASRMKAGKVVFRSGASHEEILAQLVEK